MADPRFYDNRGPFTLAQLCAALRVPVPDGADASVPLQDLAPLDGAGPGQLSFCSGASKAARKALAETAAGVCLIDASAERASVPAGTVAVVVPEPAAAFAAAGRLFYPDNALVAWSQQTPVDPTAQIGERVVLGPGVVIGPGAQVGDGTQIGANSVIGRGVAIGRDCEIGCNVSITHAYLGDRVLVLPGARVGQPGFGFVSGPAGHLKVPQLGRVIIQDAVEVGANTTIDRGSLGDTLVGEGTKIDNLVQIGHNDRLGRHCVIIAMVGLSGSVELGDYVVMGGQAGAADHAKIGSGARLAARSGVPQGEVPGGQDYGGYPIRPIKDWRREVAAVALLAKRGRRNKDG